MPDFPSPIRHSITFYMAQREGQKSPEATGSGIDPRYRLKTFQTYTRHYAKIYLLSQKKLNLGTKFLRETPPTKTNESIGRGFQS